MFSTKHPNKHRRHDRHESCGDESPLDGVRVISVQLGSPNLFNSKLGNLIKNSYCSTDIETAHIGHSEKEGSPRADKSGMAQKSHSDNGFSITFLQL